MSRRIGVIALSCIGLLAGSAGARTRDPISADVHLYLVDATVREQGIVNSGGATFASGPTRDDADFVTFSAATPAQAKRAATHGRADDQHGSRETGLFAAVAPGRLPEPASWALMLIGFGAIGAATRRTLRRSDQRFTERMRQIAAGEAE